ncbi:beta-hydroxyacyl-ACP dehydratase [Kutzneria sp. CA-103260]|nr:beta-hydroxyacyl-ACP dehydratase [Kutzneria sp. CA-103260]
MIADVRVHAGLTADGAKWRAAASARITGDEPVFAGHYPGFPIFPGVCVLECVTRGAELTASEFTAPGPGVLRGIESARFLGAVFPGDELDIALEWTGRDGDWVCKATVSVGSRSVGSVRLGYKAGVAA